MIGRRSLLQALATLLATPVVARVKIALPIADTPALAYELPMVAANHLDTFGKGVLARRWKQLDGRSMYTWGDGGLTENREYLLSHGWEMRWEYDGPNFWIAENIEDWERPGPDYV